MICGQGVDERSDCVSNFLFRGCKNYSSLNFGRGCEVQLSHRISGMWSVLALAWKKGALALLVWEEQRKCLPSTIGSMVALPSLNRVINRSYIVLILRLLSRVVIIPNCRSHSRCFPFRREAWNGRPVGCSVTIRTNPNASSISLREYPCVDPNCFRT
jgi:hypothetical protein